LERERRTISNPLVPADRIVTLSSYQAKALEIARAAGKVTVRVSPDLNLTKVDAALTSDHVVFPNGILVDWRAVGEMRESGRKCFEFSERGVWEIMIFSETTRWLRQLAATEGAPTMLVSGKPMHRIKDVDPMEDTRRKIAAVAPLRGRVLDTATGLGYTAIEAARTAKHVTTIELDPASLEIAKHNPWSAPLFSSEKIDQRMGNAFDVVSEFEDGLFDVILHDPPTKSLAGELYSGEFYSRLFRVLSRNGKVFHYVGDPDSGLGATTTQGVIRRLYEAGFRKVVRKPEAFGVLAYKSLPGRDRAGTRGPAQTRTKRDTSPVTQSKYVRPSRRQ
jgi:predicted methyltransferase